MKIQAITIGGYRNLLRTRFELGGIVPVIATNNYGKTNVLDGICAGFEFLTMSPTQRLQLMGDPKEMPLTITTERDHFFFQVEFDATYDEERFDPYRHVVYGYEFEWSRNDPIRDETTPGRIVDEWLAMAPEPGKKSTSYFRRSTMDYKPSHSATRFKRQAVSSAQLLLDVLTADDDIDISRPLRLVRDLVLYGFKTLDPKSEGTFRHQLAMTEYKRAEDPLELASMLAGLYALSPDRYEEFLDTVYDLFPSFETLNLIQARVPDEVRESVEKIRFYFEGTDSSEERANVNGTRPSVPFTIKEEIYRIMVKDRNLNQPVDLSRMSNGTARVIMLLAGAASVDLIKKPLLAIEEIETSVHPKLMGDLLTAIEGWRGDSSYLVTSHSPLMTQYLDFSKIYVGVPNDAGVADFRKFTKTGLKRLKNGAWDVGVGTGEYLFQLLCDESVPDRLEPYLTRREGTRQCPQR